MPRAVMSSMHNQHDSFLQHDHGLYDLTRRSAFLQALDTTPLPTGRIIHTVIGLLCLVLLSSLFGNKLHQLTTTRSPTTTSSHPIPLRALLTRLSSLQPIRLFTLALYIDAILLVLVELLLSSGITFTSASVCTVTGYLDTLLFFASKVLLQFFLLERLRVARSALVDRWKDPVYVIPLALLCAGFVALAGVGFRWLYHDYSAGKGGERAEGSCAIGFPNGVAVALLGFDVVVSVCVTGLFVWVLKSTSVTRGRGVGVVRIEDAAEEEGGRQSPWRKLLGVVGVASVSERQESDAENTLTLAASIGSAAEYSMRPHGSEKVVRLIKKTLIGAVLTYIPFSVNLALLVSSRGMEQGWYCFVICTLDATCCVCVVHWLTSASEDDKDLR